jgi:C-terminal processing protease CtpA/Prc
VGLGFAYELDKQTQQLRVTKVFSNSPASRAGLTAGLVIQRIENNPTNGKSVAECQTLLRANGSPKVRLELVDPQRNQTNVVEVTRGKFVTAG